jgi:ATP-dependent RNA helicase DHX8/PRP22
VQGRQHRVDAFYTPQPQDSYLDAALTTILQLHCDEDAGDVLVFLTGQEEIESCERLLKERSALLADGTGQQTLLVLSMYAALPADAQMRVFHPTPAGMRKV